MKKYFKDTKDNQEHQEDITYGSILFRYHFSEDLVKADSNEQVQKLLGYHIEEEGLELIGGVGVGDLEGCEELVAL